MAAQAEQPAPNPVYGVGERRFEITPPMDAAFGDPRLFRHPLLRGLLHSLLGEAMRLSGLTLVVSYPGAEKQHTHRDHPLLFDDPALSSSLPPYAINVAVPLNRSRVVRPIVYMVCARTWFFDEINHPMRPSLGMMLEDYNRLPEDVRLLVLRVFSQHARARFFVEPHDG
jgi:hypothetical protein